MKRKINEINTESFYNVLLYTDETHSISINREDVNHLFEGATSLAFLVAHGDNLCEILRKLNPEELDFGKATKAIFVVRYSQNYSLTALELSELQRYINENVPKTDIRWGLATTRETDENVTVVVATTH